MTVSSTMRASVIDRFGPPENLRLADLPVPVPGPDEALVRVRAAGVNAIDWYARGGGMGGGSFPMVLGWDISGTVVTPAAGGPQAGAEVFGMLRFPALASCYAEYVVAPAGELAPKPDNIDHRVAAAAPMPGITAWQALHREGRIAAGQRVLINGAAGGVGHLAVQLARVAGAEVIAVAAKRNQEFLLGLGASQVIDYQTERVEDLVSELDLVLDHRGGDDFYRLARTLRRGGTIVTLKGEQPGYHQVLRDLRVRAGYVYVSPDARALAELARLLADGSVVPVIGRAFPLDQAADAHATGERGSFQGRLVLDLN